MRKFAVVLLVIGMTQATAFGGLISFEPEKTTIDIDAGDSTLVKINVFVSGLGAINDGFQSLDVLFGANELDLVDFVIETTLSFGFINVDTNPVTGVYADEILAGGFAFAAIPAVGPVLFGSLTVEAAGLGYGNYEIIVDGFNDGDRSVAVNVTRDILAGVGSINIVPEPATITLLGLASLALIRRRRQA